MTKYQKDLISIIIPTRGNRDITPTLTSVKNQTEQNFEVIRILDKEKKGAPWARNQGEKKAHGEFLLFLDDDIVLDKTFLFEMKKVLEEHKDYSFAYCHYRRKGGGYDDISKAYPFDLDRLKKHWNYVSTMSLMRHGDFTPWDESLKRFQDWDFWLTLGEQGRRGFFIDRILFSAHYPDKGITNEDKKEIVKLADKVRIKHGMRSYVTIRKAKDVLRPFYHAAKKAKIVPERKK